jgi:rSAM/selenodomain-associated transferase 2/rSAM/selenodomain-associated transferase 1
MPAPPSERRLILFSRYPVPGRAKTRLIPLLGPLGAAEAHRWLTENTLAVLMRSYRAPVEMAYTDATRDQVRRWLTKYRIPCYPQPEGDLGRRMASVIRRAFDQGAQQVVLVGTDVPGIKPRHVAAAFDALAGHDMVLGPSHDGGYWLIGCRRPIRVFNGIDWGTSSVLDQTIRAAEDQGLSSTLLERLQDIDTEADIRRWRPEREWARPYLSIVIPTLNEADRIAPLVATLGASDIEIVVVDGGSRDGTPQVAREAGAVVIDAPRGRASQQNAGAARAAGKILLFLHADTHLPGDFGAQVFERLMDPRVVLGAFRFKTDWDHWAMRWIERGVQARSVLLQLPYGDQALFMRKAIFEQVGGFPEVPFAEDLLLARKLARRGRIELTPGAVVTSSRRWRAAGIWRVTLINYLIALGCLLGIHPAWLAPVHRYGHKFKRRVDQEHGADS